MVVAGVAGVTAGIGLAAWWSMRLTRRGHLELGIATIGPAAIAGLALLLLLAGPAVAFTVLPAAALVGFALGRGDDADGGGSDDEPPWWQSFERDLRDYERTRPRPRARD